MANTQLLLLARNVKLFLMKIVDIKKGAIYLHKAENPFFSPKGI